jgi:hypothetical protein
MAPPTREPFRSRHELREREERAFKATVALNSAFFSLNVLRAWRAHKAGAHHRALIRAFWAGEALGLLRGTLRELRRSDAERARRIAAHAASIMSDPRISGTDDRS